MALSSYYNNNNWGPLQSTTTLESLHSDLFTNDYDFPITELETEFEAELEAELLGFCTDFDNDSFFSIPNHSFSYTDTDCDFDPDQFLDFGPTPPQKPERCYENTLDTSNVAPDFHSNQPLKRQLCYENNLNSTNAANFAQNPPLKRQLCYENTLDSINVPDFDPNPPSKRQKCYENTINSINALDFCNGYAPGFCPMPVPQMTQPSEDFDFADTTNYSSDDVKQFNGNKEMSNPSPQTMAARTRRRKITEKTGELGKLVPGGNKMNTAEMLQSAFKYIKYMQASVSVFQSMGAFQEKMVANEGSMENLQFLLQSSIIQEKLYTEEHCIVPLQFIKVLAEDQEQKSSEPSIRHNLNQLIQLEKLGE